MVKLPVGVDINNLIDDLRIFSWEAADILLYYSHKLKNTDKKNEIIDVKIIFFFNIGFLGAPGSFPFVILSSF